MPAFSASEIRKGGRVVEGTALEKRHTGNGIESSNLSLSAVNFSERGKKGANYLASGEDEKDGAMFRQQAEPRVGVAEIHERRRMRYP